MCKNIPGATSGYHPNICLEGLRKATSDLAEIRTGYVPNSSEKRYRSIVKGKVR
jgi:hypothetical protein